MPRFRVDALCNIWVGVKNKVVAWEQTEELTRRGQHKSATDSTGGLIFARGHPLRDARWQEFGRAKH